MPRHVYISNLDSTFDVLILVHVSHGFLCYTALKNDKLDIEDITRRPEDMNFISSCKNTTLRTSTASE